MRSVSATGWLGEGPDFVKKIDDMPLPGARTGVFFRIDDSLPA